MKVVDLLGNPIYRALYEVKDQKTGKVIAKGGTTIKGDIVPISRDKGTVLDIYIRNMFTMDFKKLGSVTLNKDRMVATIRSPKVMIDALTTLYEGATQTYKRKTHTVKAGDTLSKIAKESGTTVRALVQLNNLEDENKLSVGQVIKLPVEIPATGNNHYEEKPKTQEQPRAENKPQTSTKVEQPVEKAPTPVSATEAQKKAEEWQKQQVEQANQAKKIPIQTTSNRSEATGTPKTDVANPCQSQPQCIASGSGELIREINIRLAGFGGALPTDQFTDLTASCIKQFQRDYMGVAETGKICGSLLVALDRFSMEFNEDIFTLPKHKVKCPCKKCDGYGNNRKGQYSVTIKKMSKVANGIEYPGIHRSLLWAYKAINFYFKKTTNPEGYYIHHIESGYRCIENNIQHHRASSNHMGCAIDFHVYNKAGRQIIGTEIEEVIRKKWLMKNQKAWFGWAKNKFGLERNSDGSDSWIHIDVREYEDKYKVNKLFAKNLKELNGQKLLEIAMDRGLTSLMQCSGLAINKNIQEQKSDSSILINSTQLKKLFPKANQSDIDIVVKEVNDKIKEFKLDTHIRQRHFFSQVRGEIGNELQGKTEEWIYSPDALKGFSKYYREHPDEAEQDGYLRDKTYKAPKGGPKHKYLRHANIEAISRKHFQKKNGNRKNFPSDGYNLRGRGLLQITGYEKYNGFQKAYSKYWKDTPPNFIENPEQINKMPYAIRCAMWFWAIQASVYTAADKNNGYRDVIEVTKVVNGGANGLNHRQEAYKQAEEIFK